MLPRNITPFSMKHFRALSFIVYELAKSKDDWTRREFFVVKRAATQCGPLSKGCSSAYVQVHYYKARGPREGVLHAAPEILEASLQRILQVKTGEPLRRGTTTGMRMCHGP